jgi:tRNA (cytosine34-C5)-methyltransferase
MRKNVDVWKKWNGANGNNLHWLQFRIARRRLELLNTDGLMVYSTCSLNPVEDEAVLCRLMRQYPGCIQLVEVSDRVPGLKYAPGITYWKPRSRDKVFYEKPEEVPKSFQSQIRAAMFPPSKEELFTNSTLNAGKW